MLADLYNFALKDQVMRMGKRVWALGGAALAVFTLALAPAHSAPGKSGKYKRMRASTGVFTPAGADPRLAAAFSRGTVRTSLFQVTPVATKRPTRAVTVAVRARTSAPPRTLDRVAIRSASAAPPVVVGPASYNLGVSVGWRRFALSGEVSQSDLGTIQGGRRVTDVGVSYSRKRLTTRVQLESEQPTSRRSGLLDRNPSVAVDFGGSYRLTRKINLTAGLRYKAERDPLEPKADARRDSQAVYVGTKFEF
jgi:hypothetical protein